MYKLENDELLTEEIKNAFKHNVVRNKVIFNDTNIGELNESNYINESTLEELRYVPNLGFIGQCVSKRVTLKIENEDNQFNLENKEFEYKLGAETLSDNKMHYINYGNFIVQAPENDDVNETSEIEALDYMCKFNQRYICGINDFENATLLTYALDVCKQCGVELGNNFFSNAQQSVGQNPFINNEQCRDVIQSIAKLSFSWARIGQDNKLYFDFMPNDIVTEVIDIDGYINLESNNETKPITSIVLKSSVVEKDDENIPVEGVIIKADGKPCWEGGPIYPDLISEYGENQLVITEDYFSYDEATRRRFIQEASKLFGLKYVPLSVDLIGSAYLSSNDFIEIINFRDISLKTYCLNQTINYNGTLYNTIESEAPTETEGKYTYEGTDLTVKQTQIIVNKSEQRITATVSDLSNTVNEYDGKITQIQADLSGVISQVSQFVDLTNTATGQKKIIIEKAIQGILLKLRIAGNDTVFGDWTFNDNWYFDDNWYFSDGCEILINDITVYDLKIKTGALRYFNENVYDEYVYDYEKLETYVIRRVGITSEGVKYQLENPIYEYISGGTTGIVFEPINLIENNNTIEIVNYSANIEAKFIAQNEYSNVFATKVELNSSIEQTEKDINLSVNEKIQGLGEIYTKKSELNIESGRINSLVSETRNLGNKIEVAESKIEQTVKSISLNVNNGDTTAGIVISLQKEDGSTQELYGTIDMRGLVKFTDLSGSGTTVINGSNIRTGKIDASLLNTDNLNAITGKIGGFNITNDSLDSSTVGMSNGHYYSFYVKNGGETVYFVTLSGDVSCKSLIVNGYPLPLTSAEPGKQIITEYIDGNQLVVNTGSGLYVFLPDAISSDRNLKENIKETDVNALDIISKMDFVQYDWKNTGQHEFIGVIAQDIEKIEKELVSDIKMPDGTESKIFNNARMDFVNSKAIQELNNEIKELKKENEKLKYMLNDLLQRIEIVENKEGKNG